MCIFKLHLNICNIIPTADKGGLFLNDIVPYFNDTMVLCVFSRGLTVGASIKCELPVTWIPCYHRYTAADRSFIEKFPTVSVVSQSEMSWICSRERQLLIAGVMELR